jgi:hypothetical protein
MEVQILANGDESERIDQLCLWMVEAQITAIICFGKE